VYRWAWFFVRRWRLPPGLQFDDLVAAGYLGLVRACQRYDPNRGTRVSTYASPFILQAMLVAVALDQCRGFTGIYARVLNGRRHNQELLDRLRSMGHIEIEAAERQLPSVPPDRRLEDREFLAHILRAWRRRSTRRRGAARRLGADIIRDRWLRWPPASLAELGRRYGVSRERVRQLEERVRVALRPVLYQQLA